MKQFFLLPIWLFALSFFAAPPTLADNPQGPLRFGIVPFNSTALLFKTHQPLNRFLAASLGQSVRFYTSPDHATFLHDALAGSFDLMIVSPHFVPFLIQEGYTPLLRYQSETDVLLVLPKNAHYDSLDDLRGKRIGFPDRMSFVTINSLMWLEQHGLSANRDFQMQMLPSLAAAAMSVSTNTLDAAISAKTAINQLPADVRERLQIHKLNEKRQPSLMLLARNALGATKQHQIVKALEHFAASPSGQKFFAETGYIGFAPVTQEEIDALAIYVPITEKLLKQPQSIFATDDITTSSLTPEPSWMPAPQSPEVPGARPAPDNPLLSHSGNRSPTP